jgi:hypothetical protein
METQVNTKHFDARIASRTEDIQIITQLKKSGVTHHEKYCVNQIKNLGHALIAAKADVLRAENAKRLFQNGVPFGVAISAGNRNAIEILEVNPKELELHGEVITQNEEVKGFFVCIDGKIEQTSEYFVFLSSGGYSLVKLVGTL